MDDDGPGAAVEELDAHQHVGDGGLQSRKGDALARKTAGSRRDRAPLDQRIRELVDARILQISDVIGKLQRDGQAHAGEHRRAPQHCVLSERRLGDFEVAGARLVRRHRSAYESEQEPQRAGPRAAPKAATHCGAASFGLGPCFFFGPGGGNSVG